MFRFSHVPVEKKPNQLNEEKKNAFSKERLSTECTTVTGKSLERTYKHIHSISVREFVVIISQY